MEATARVQFARFAPRKVNQVLGLIRRKSVQNALTMLRFVPKSCAVIIGKTIKNAAANAGDPLAKNENLIVTSAWVGQGPMGQMKRMLPAPMGRAMTFKRKVCHLTVVVSQR